MVELDRTVSKGMRLLQLKNEMVQLKLEYDALRDELVQEMGRNEMEQLILPYNGIWKKYNGGSIIYKCKTPLDLPLILQLQKTVLDKAKAEELDLKGELPDIIVKTIRKAYLSFFPTKTSSD